MHLILDVRPREAADPLVGRWLAYLGQGRERTLSMVEGLDEVALHWTSSEHPNSVGTLLYHIAAIELDWLYAEILEQPIPPEVREHLPFKVSDEAGRLTPVDGWDIARHSGLLERSYVLLENTLITFDAGEFLRTRVLPDYSVTPEWVCLHLLQHEASHRGQMARLLAARAEREQEK